jgi:hypothetical protein
LIAFALALTVRKPAQDKIPPSMALEADA